MMAWVVTVAYVVGMVPAWRAVFRATLAASSYGEVDGEDIVMCAVMASLVCWFWPLIAPFALVWKATKGDPARTAKALGGEGRDQKLRRLEMEARDRERRIRELEREAGIR